MANNQESERCRSISTVSPEVARSLEKLSKLRTRILELDREAMRIIGKRMKIAAKIGEIKREIGLPLTNSRIEANVRRNILDAGRNAGLSEAFATRIFNLLVKESICVQSHRKCRNLR
jgi:chorismate mutase